MSYRPDTSESNVELKNLTTPASQRSRQVRPQVAPNVGIKYQKSRDNAEMLVGNLNLSDLYLEGPQRSSSLGEFVEHVEKAFA